MTVWMRVTVDRFLAGHTYDVPEAEGRTLVAQGWAEPRLAPPETQPAPPVRSKTTKAPARRRRRR